MANTYQLIEAQTLGSSATSVTFSAIPATYTDLLLKASIRGNVAQINQSYQITFNGTSTTGISMKRLYGTGAAAASDSLILTEAVGASATANTFSNEDIYIPNYLSTANAKSFSIDGVIENNGTTGYQVFYAGLWNPATQAAISSIVLTAQGGSSQLVQYSSFYLYGIKNS
jgi:hypothetical protein